MTKSKKKKQNHHDATSSDAEKSPVEEAQADDAAAAVSDSTDDTECAAAEAEIDINALFAERAALGDRLLRLQADFENFRKRTQRERSDLSRRATEHLMEELLPILDHFELGFENAERNEANPAVVEGFRLVYDQVINTLGKFGLTAIAVEGQHFDPHLHEAITHLPSEEHPPDTVVTQTRRGYLLGDRLLRAAQVVVSSGQATEVEDEADVAGTTGDDAR